MTDTDDATVLVVDDESDIVDLYSTLLSTEYNIRTANNGREALEKCDESVDVVLLDRRMPDMTGDKVLAELRDRGITSQVAMLSAVEPDQDIVDMPFDDYLTKPADRSDLLGLVDTLLERQKFDCQSQEFFSLASKKAALEIADKNNTAEYNQLTEQLKAKRSEIETLLDNVETESLLTKTPDCEA